MSAAAGWYPDPGGQAGMFRYWDGQQWSAALSPTPAAPPPAGGSAPITVGGTRYPTTGVSPGQAGQPGQPSPGQRKLWPWLLGGAVLLVVLAVVVAFALSGSRGGGLGPIINPGDDPTPSAEPCPKRTNQPTSGPRAGSDANRVFGGPLSYPKLGAPWSEVELNETRLPFGRDVAKQQVMVEPGYDGLSSWVASVLVAELTAGDGFFSPQEGSEIVVRCVLGEFYGNAKVSRDDVRNEAMTVDGREAWVVESNLSFNIPKLKTKGELLIVVIVNIDDSRSGIYYASIPDTTPELVAGARNAMRDLKVVT